MLQIKKFTFNPFAENTYVVSAPNQECIIIDPGMINHDENQQLEEYIQTQSLTPIQLLNTHCHIDHVLGNQFVSKKYGLQLQAHQSETTILEMASSTASMYGLPYTPSPEISEFLDETQRVKLGDFQFDILFTPGHSPGSISFYCAEAGVLISGDVLFKRSIGRTDLPMGDFETLISSIRTQLFRLPQEVIVYNGHGPETNIGEEMQYNPFLNGEYTL